MDTPPIEPIEGFAPSRSNRSKRCCRLLDIGYQLQVSGGMLLVAGIVALFLQALGFGSLAPALGFGSLETIGVALLGLGALMLMAGRSTMVFAASKLDDLRRARYHDYLTTLDQSLLITAQRSPEIDKESREAIAEFLNENHPGWSFEAQRVGRQHAPFQRSE